MSKAVLAAILIPQIVLASAGIDQTQGKAAPNREELHAVLLQARDALIEVAAHADSTFDNVTSDDLHLVVTGLLDVGDRGAVIYLQKHLPKPYEGEILEALHSPAKLSDQEAIANARKMPDSRDRALALITVAEHQYQSHKDSEAQNTLDLALNSAVEPGNPQLSLETPRDKLMALSVWVGGRDVRGSCFLRPQ